MRIAIMSFAHLHADAYLNILRDMPDVDVIGLADNDADRGQHFASLYGATYFESYRALVAEQPDAVVICSENVHHNELAQLAIAAGSHILCEKPLATTISDGKAMLDGASSANVHIMTAFPMRFNTPAMEVKKLIESNTLGNIYGINGVNQGSLPTYHVTRDQNYRKWFVDQNLAGGGAVIDHVVHLADMLRWYLGVEVTEVYAATSRVFYSDHDLNVETGGLVTLTFENGVFATIDCSWSKPGYYSTWGNLKFDLVAEFGLVTFDAFKQNMTIYSDTVQRPTLAFWGSDANAAMLREFVASVRENRESAVTGYDGYKAMEIALAAYRSAETDQVVTLPLEQHN